MRLIVAVVLSVVAVPVASEPFRSYADCIKALDQALSLAPATESLSRSALQSIKGNTVTDKDGTEIDIVSVNGDLTRANAKLIAALAATCESLR